jgi:hypothetical protein
MGNDGQAVVRYKSTGMKAALLGLMEATYLTGKRPITL